MDFVKKIDFVRKSGIGVPRILTIDLSIAATDKVYDMAGNVFYVMDAPNTNDYIDVKFNETRESAIRLKQQMGLSTPFYRLYITTPSGQTGTMTILYANEAPDFLQIIDNRSATSLELLDVLAELEDIHAELQGDTTPENWDTEKTVGVAVGLVLASNANRKACNLQAKESNTGLIYIGFSNLVTATKWVWQLQPGQSLTIDDYRGDLYAISDTAAQFLGYGEW